MVSLWIFNAPLPVNEAGVARGAHKDGALANAAWRRLGGWREAVEKAGIRYAAVSLTRRR